MKPSEIVMGGTYASIDGVQRKIIAEGEQFADDSNQTDRDCVRWERLDTPWLIRKNMTRLEFSEWAHERVVDVPSHGSHTAPIKTIRKDGFKL